MTANGWFQIGLYLLLLLAITKPLGVYMARVFSGEKTFMDPMLRPVERLLYRVTGVDETHEMRWTEYATAMLLLSVVSMILLYIILRVQQWLPWNPQHFGAVAPDLAFNTAASFTTNTNWQVVFRRIDDELFHADGRACVSQLPLGSDRHSAGDRGDSRNRAEGDANDRKFLGGPDSDDSVGAAAGVRRCCVVSRVAGNGAEPEALCDRETRRSRKPCR